MGIVGSNVLNSLSARVHIKVTQPVSKFHGLFDFSRGKESLEISDFVASQSGFFILDIQTDTLFEAKQSTEASSKRNAKQFKFSIETGTFTDLTPFISESHDAWVFLDELNEIELKENDLLRFGKLKVRVQSVRLPETTVTKRNVFCSSNRSKSKNYAIAEQLVQFRESRPTIRVPRSLRCDSVSSKSQVRCRICFEAETIDARFAVVCRCSHQMPVHFNCVRRWITKSREVVRRGTTIFDNSSGEAKCEICNERYPFEVLVGGRLRELFRPILHPNESHVTLSMIHKKLNVCCGYISLRLKEEEGTYSVGRDDQCDVQLTDLSVSNKHATIVYSRGKLKVSDIGSKFGTFRRIESISMPSKRNSVLKVQVNRFLFEFHKFHSSSCFCDKETKGETSVDPWRSVPVIFKAEASQLSPRPGVVVKESRETVSFKTRHKIINKSSNEQLNEQTNDKSQTVNLSRANIENMNPNVSLFKIRKLRK